MKSKKSYHHPDLRNALILEGLAFLKKNKVEDLSLRRLAAKLKVSHMAPYRHFADKEALLAAIIEQGFIELEKKSLSAVQQTKDFMTQFKNLGLAYVQFICDNPDHARLMFGGLLWEPGKYKEAESCGDRAFQVLMDLILYGQQTGYLKNDPPLQMAFMIWSMVHGFSLLMIERQFDFFLDPNSNDQSDSSTDPTMGLSIPSMVNYMADSMMSGLLKRD